jgi:predicted nucleic acid-binding protein
VKAAVDTNVLAYAEGIDDAQHAEIAREVLDRVVPIGAVVAVQTIGELFNVLRRKGKLAPAQARLSVLSWHKVFHVVGTTPDLFAKAIDLAADHHLRIWDSIILATASAAGCQILLSEDLQDGFVWGGVTVVDPFAAKPHPLLISLLAR